MKDDSKILGTEKVSKLLLKFSIPCILSLLISSLYNIVDQIFIGNSDIGYLGNTATSVVFPITIISVAFAWCFGDGSAAYLSLCQGKNDTKGSHKAIGNSILVTIIISVIFVVLGFLFMDKLLYLFGASNSSIGLAKDYFKIILAFIPAYMLGNMMNSVIRADGSPGFASFSTMVGAVTNIILDPVFIFGFKWGIKGAAWATIIGQVLSLIISIFYFVRKTKTFKIQFDSFKIDMKLFSNVIKLGISTFITQMSIVVISLVSNIMLAKYGRESIYGADIPIATVGICMKVFTIIINIVVGVILGAQPILGYNIGAKKIKRVKEVFKLVLLVTVIVGLIGTLLFELVPDFIIKLFGTESELYMEFAVLTFRIFLMLVLFTCIIKMISIFFQAVGEPLKAAIISLSRDIICFVPLVIILPCFLGVKGILWAAPIADLIGIVLATILVYQFFKKLGSESASEEDEINIKESHPGLIITISRMHGSRGKYIGELVAKNLNIPFYYKEVTALAAQSSGLDKEYISMMNNKDNISHDLYLTTAPAKYAIEAQDKIIKKIADEGSCVIVGRAADHILRERNDVIKVFIYANVDYRIKSIMEMYNDERIAARKHMIESDKRRKDYYRIMSGRDWGDLENYDICINSSIGPEATAKTITEYIKNCNKH